MRFPDQLKYKLYWKFFNVLWINITIIICNSFVIVYQNRCKDECTGEEDDDDEVCGGGGQYVSVYEIVKEGRASVFHLRWK